MKALDHLEMIKRLFAAEAIEIYEPESVAFSCSCSETRLANSLVTLGKDELNELFAASPVLALTCEFCKTVYEFDETRLMTLVHGDADTH